MFRPDPHSDLPLVRQCYDALAQRIIGGELKVGTRLPSLRAQARDAGVSILTVTNAYARLAAEGLVEARAGSGYFVASRRPRARRDTSASTPRREVDSLWLLRRVYEEDDTLIHAGCGWLRPDWLPLDAVRQALGELHAADPAMLGRYGTPLGHPRLRALIAGLLDARGIPAQADTIVLTQGASQALSVIGKALLRPGDTVLVDAPGSTNFFATLRAQGLQLVGVPRGVDGPDPEALAALAQRHRPKAFFTTMHLQNPTGSSCSPAVAYQVLRLAEHYDFHVVENDVMAGLEPPGLPSLASLDGLNRVIYVGSFSKTLSPSLRVGFLAGNAAMIDKLVFHKLVDGLTSSSLAEQVVANVLAAGGYEAHMKTLAARLAQAQARLCDGLEAAGMQVFTRPPGGLYLWAGFPEGSDAQALAQDAVDAGIVLAPGALFDPAQRATQWLRFNACHADDPAVFGFLKQHGAGKSA